MPGFATEEFVDGQWVPGVIPDPPLPPAPVTYVHVQTSALATWVVPHNLGVRPDVAITTTGGVEILGGEVVHLTVNTLQITFDEPFTGQARCT